MRSSRSPEPAVPPPAHVQVKITSKCNLRCRTCSLWRKDIESGPGGDPDARQLSENELGDVVVELADWGVRRLELADGEPFLRRVTPALVEQASALGLDTLAISNGTLIDAPLAVRLIRGGLRTLVVSIDGPGPLHDEIRGVPGTFARLTEAIRRLELEKSRAGSSTPVIIVHTVVSRLNYRYLAEILEIAGTSGAGATVFRYLSQVPGEAVERTNELLGGAFASHAHHYAVEEDLQIPDGDLTALQAQIGRLADAGRQRASNFSLDPLLLEMIREKRRVERRFQSSTCPLVGDFLQLSPRGRVHLCPMLTGCGVGSIRDLKVKDIYESADSRQLIDRIQDLFPLPICPHCCYRTQ